jgi:hypothetical protein
MTPYAKLKDRLHFPPLLYIVIPPCIILVEPLVRAQSIIMKHLSRAIYIVESLSLAPGVCLVTKIFWFWVL